MVARARRLYVVEPGTDLHADAKPRLDGGADEDEHEPQSESEVADLDARLTGMSSFCG